MTTQAPERRTILAAVQGLGKQEKSDGWMLTLAYKFTGSHYNLNLYGKEWAQVNHLKIGQMATFLVEKGGQKKNKEGQLQDPQYDSSFFWNLVEAKVADGVPAPQATPAVQPQAPAPRQAPTGSDAPMPKDPLAGEKLPAQPGTSPKPEKPVYAAQQGDPWHRFIAWGDLVREARAMAVVLMSEDSELRPEQAFNLALSIICEAIRAEQKKP